MKKEVGHNLFFSLFANFRKLPVGTIFVAFFRRKFRVAFSCNFVYRQIIVFAYFIENRGLNTISIFMPAFFKKFHLFICHFDTAESFGYSKAVKSAYILFAVPSAAGSIHAIILFQKQIGTPYQNKYNANKNYPFNFFAHIVSSITSGHRFCDIYPNCSATFSPDSPLLHRSNNYIF